ncbi:MAG: hypothetical protein AB7P03_21930 [Kofleriaceae bacterium]
MGALSKILVIGVVTTGIAACGGASDPPPGPLTSHFDDMYLAAVPLEQQQIVIQTEHDWRIAKMENAKAEADLNEAATQIAIANNDYQSTRLAIDSAVSEKKSAEASANTTRINQATKDLHTAEAVSKAAESRVRYYKLYRDYLEKYHRYTLENMYWRESQYEVAKAQVAQRNNIAPRNGPQFSDFPKQESERNKRAQSAKQKAEAEKQEAMKARTAWLSLQQTADRELGRPSVVPDPLAPRAAQAPVAPTTPVGPVAPTTPVGPVAPAAPAATPAPTAAPSPAPRSGT